MGVAADLCRPQAMKIEDQAAQALLWGPGQQHTSRHAESSPQVGPQPSTVLRGHVRVLVTQGYNPRSCCTARHRQRKTWEQAQQKGSF